MKVLKQKLMDYYGIVYDVIRELFTLQSQIHFLIQVRLFGGISHTHINACINSRRDITIINH